MKDLILIILLVFSTLLFINRATIIKKINENYVAKGGSGGIAISYGGTVVAAGGGGMGSYSYDDKGHRVIVNYGTCNCTVKQEN